jgi:hypothetical protein
MAKIICVLYDDPVDGYPKTYARDDVTQPERYPDGQTAPPERRIIKATLSRWLLRIASATRLTRL